MKTFRILPHTADIRLEVKSSTLAELFSAALEGMNEIIKPGFCDQRPLNLREEIAGDANNATEALIDFLSEINTLSHANKALYCGCELSIVDDHGYRGIARGVAVDGFAEDIKAVTYHEADVVQGPDGVYTTVIVFDI
ncbi:MAG TPA: archease [candidate division Zixibacteria bacterium]|nr:archease [candidate division Zixibacteria bacterium]